MGFKGKQSGLVTRPDMPNAALTIHYLQQYILSIGEAKSAHLPLQRLEGGETIDFPRPDEISAEDRYKNYMKLVKRRRRSGWYFLHEFFDFSVTDGLVSRRVFAFAV